MNTTTEDSIPARELDIASMQLGIDRLEFALQSREEVRVMAQTLAEQARLATADPGPGTSYL